MAGQSELATALQFVKQQCGADAAGGVHPGVAPPGTLTPFITVQSYGGSDTVGIAGTRLLVRGLWLIEVWGQPDTPDGYAAVDAAAVAMDTHLQGQKHVGLPGGAVVVACYRTQPRLAFEYDASRALWVRQGGVYEIQV